MTHEVYTTYVKEFTELFSPFTCERLSAIKADEVERFALRHMLLLKLKVPFDMITSDVEKKKLAFYCIAWLTYASAVSVPSSSTAPT